MRYLEKPREFHGLPLVSVRSLLILSASSLSLWLGAPAQAQSPPSAAVQPPPVVRTVGTDIAAPTPPPPDVLRSEEHTSELQSLMRSSYAVFCLKKKNYKTQNIVTTQITKPHHQHADTNHS